MKFLAVFVTLAVAAFGYPTTTTWTLEELANALQSPGLDPVLVPLLEDAINQMMNALHQGQTMETITIDMPVVAEYTLNDLSAAIQDPNTNPAHIPYLENALNQLMAALHAGEDKPSITVVLPGIVPVVAPASEPDFIDVWPIQTPDEEPNFVDVWPVVVPEAEAAAPPAAAAPSSPLVQIIVNVQKQQAPEDPFDYEIERPMPAEVVDDLPGWGNFIDKH